MGKEGRKQEGVENVPTCILFYRRLHEIEKIDY
jgi:hypothetical protein